MARTAIRNGAALLFCALPLLGCAGGGGAGGGLSAASADRGRFEGRYVGRRLPLGSTGPYACRGQARAVRFVVEKGIIEMRPAQLVRSKRKTSLWGAVSSDGQVTMRPASGGTRMVVGRIQDGRLTLTDAQESQALAQNAMQGGRSPCQYRYEATRVGSGSGGEDGADPGTPPAERSPQP